jgi:AcrR family transcriptional regulator
MSTGARENAKQKTRAALIEAGIDLIAAQGLDGPSLDAICERAGYTRGAFYVHFKDRDDFLVAVMETAGGPILDRVLEGDGDLSRTFAHFMRAFADGSYPLGPRGGIKPHQLLDACARVPRIRELYVGLVNEAIARVARVVAESQTTGVVRSDVDGEAIGALLLAAVIGAQTMLELEVPIDLGRSAGAMLTLLTPR